MRPIQNFIYVLLFLPLQAIGSSSLVIELPTPDPVLVIINFESYTASSRLVVPQLTAGNYAVTIMRRIGAQGRMQIMLDEQINLVDNLESVYRVEQNRLRLIQTRPQPFGQQPPVCHTGNHHQGVNATGVFPAHQTYAMTNEQIDRFVKELNRQTFDDKKVQYASTYLNDAWLTSDQIQRIVKQLTFDNNKLELAMTLYDRAIDPANYYTVESAFSFRSTGQKLQEYIRNHR
jgi:hypothetical protein